MSLPTRAAVGPEELQSINNLLGPGGKLLEPTATLLFLFQIQVMSSLDVQLYFFCCKYMERYMGINYRINYNS